MNQDNQTITNNYALYSGDCVEVMKQLPDNTVDLSLYSPPFAGLYQYSSDEQDLSNCINQDEFYTHYEFVIQELHRLTKPGRMSAVTSAPSGTSARAAATTAG